MQEKMAAPQPEVIDPDRKESETEEVLVLKPASIPPSKVLPPSEAAAAAEEKDVRTTPAVTRPSGPKAKKEVNPTREQMRLRKKPTWITQPSGIAVGKLIWTTELNAFSTVR